MKGEAEPGVPLTEDKDHQDPQKLEEATKVCGPKGTLVSDSDLLNGERRRFCCFKQLSWWYVEQQPSESKTTWSPESKGTRPELWGETITKARSFKSEWKLCAFLKTHWFFYGRLGVEQMWENPSFSSGTWSMPLTTRVGTGFPFSTGTMSQSSKSSQQ